MKALKSVEILHTWQTLLPRGSLLTIKNLFLIKRYWKPTTLENKVPNTDDLIKKTEVTTVMNKTPCTLSLCSKVRFIIWGRQARGHDNRSNELTDDSEKNNDLNFPRFDFFTP